MRDTHLEVRISTEIDKLEGSAEEIRALAGLGGALSRRAVGPSFAAGTHHEVRRPSSPRLPRHHATAAKLDVVRMGPEGEQQSLLRSRLRRHGRWAHG